MKLTKNGYALASLFKNERTISWVDLKARAIPTAYADRILLIGAVHRMESNKHLAIEYGGQQLKKRILNLTLTDEGYKFWIQQIRTDLKPKAVYIPKGRKPRGPYITKKKQNASAQPITVDPDRFEADQMPCGARMRICYHAGCYLRFRCSASPEKEVLE